MKNKKKVKWARHCKFSSISLKKEVSKDVVKTIQAGFPCVFSVCISKKKPILGYADKEDAIYGKIKYSNPNIEEYIKEGRVNKFHSHYMTIVKVEKCLDDEINQYVNIYTVVSWGKIYYIREKDYEKNLNYFHNVLSVY